MNVKTAISARLTPFVDAIAESYQTVYGLVNRTQNTAAIADLDSLPFPTTKSEFWKYTRLSKLTKNEFRFTDASIAKSDISTISDANAVLLVFVNGVFNATRSEQLPEGLSLKLIDASEDLPEKFNVLAQPKKHVLEALNTAYCPQTAVITIDENTSTDRPIHIAHWSTGENHLSQPRLIVHAKRGSKSTIVQSFEGDTHAGFTNALSEIFVAENAMLTWNKIESQSAQHFHHSTDYVRVENGGHFSILTAPTGRAWTRNNLHIKLSGSNAFARLNGLCSLKGDQHLDNNTFVDHAVPHCDSSELYKCILSDKSTGVFNGKVIVRPDAQKTNAFQQNSNLLLSEDAQIYSKPELEIYADDVKCSHGSTTGQMDEEAVFYLQTRAIGKEDAQQMLLAAFAGEVLNQIENEAIRAHIYQKFEE